MKIRFEGELLAAPGGSNYANPAGRRRLEQAAGAFTDKTMQQVADLLRAWQADPVGIGNRYRRRFSSWEAWEAYDWHSKLAEMQLTVDTTMRVRRYGLCAGRDRVEPGR